MCCKTNGSVSQDPRPQHEKINALLCCPHLAPVPATAVTPAAASLGTATTTAAFPHPQDCLRHGPSRVFCCECRGTQRQNHGLQPGSSPPLLPHFQGQQEGPLRWSLAYGSHSSSFSSRGSPCLLRYRPGARRGRHTLKRAQQDEVLPLLPLVTPTRSAEYLPKLFYALPERINGDYQYIPGSNVIHGNIHFCQHCHKKWRLSGFKN